MPKSPACVKRDSREADLSGQAPLKSQSPKFQNTVDRERAVGSFVSHVSRSTADAPYSTDPQILARKQVGWSSELSFPFFLYMWPKGAKPVQIELTQLSVPITYPTF